MKVSQKCNFYFSSMALILYSDQAELQFTALWTFKSLPESSLGLVKVIEVQAGESSAGWTFSVRGPVCIEPENGLKSLRTGIYTDFPLKLAAWTLVALTGVNVALQ